MTSLTQPRSWRLSSFLRPFASACYEHPKKVIIITLLFLGSLLTQVLNIPIDVSTEGMLKKDDPSRVAYNAFKHRFGQDNQIILSMPIKGELDHDFFKTLYQLQMDIETTIPFVASTTSLINARVTKGEEDELIVEDLLENFDPEMPSKIDSQMLLNYVLSQPNYVNRVISSDGKHTAIIVKQSVYGESHAGQREFLAPLESQRSVQAIKTLIQNYPELDISIGGKPVLLNIINTKTFLDSSISGTAAIVLAMLFMAFFFRRLSGVFLPLVVIVGSMIAAMGVMGIFKAPFTLTIGSVFPLMVAVGVADAVHILTHFYRNYEVSGDKKSAIVDAISDSGPAVLMTSLTTAAGFLSFVSGELASTADLGIYAAVAVLFALYFTVVLLPSCIALFNIKQHAGNKGLNHQLDGFLEVCGNLACDFPKAVSLFGIGLMLLCLWGTSFLHFFYDPISRFPDATIEKTDNTRIDQAYNGITPLEVIIDTHKSRGIFEGSFIDDLEKAADSLSYSNEFNLPLNNSYSVLNILKEVHRALNNNNDDLYIVSEDKALIAQELLIFELNQAEDLRDVVDTEFQTVRLTLTTQHADGVEYAKLIRSIETQLQTAFDPSVSITVTGATALVAASVPKALMTMAKSYIVAAFIIIFIMMIMVRNIRIGLISIVPNLLPILLVMNVMVVMGWPLDMTTILVGAIAMGIVVDDTLHFLYHFKGHYEHHFNAKKAVHQTLKSTGPALFITTVIFSTGAGSNMLSSIENIFIFGLTMWLVTILALFADILIAPALLVWAFNNKTAEDDTTQDKTTQIA
ncbi:MAG: efflux RND transporter permease subunit [Cellvibrionales bacterium]|nr:efflux RND transporter permease subunit [Cellvibrionales bacterium]